MSSRVVRSNPTVTVGTLHYPVTVTGSYGNQNNIRLKVQPPKVSPSPQRLPLPPLPPFFIPATNCGNAQCHAVQALPTNYFGCYHFLSYVTLGLHSPSSWH